MSQHTPGPWRWSARNWKNEPDRCGYLYVAGDFHEEEPEGGDDTPHTTGTGVCRVEGNATSETVTKANAALITAAPDLLAACEALLADADAKQDDKAACRRLYNAWHSIRVAVAKAKGV